MGNTWRSAIIHASLGPVITVSDRRHGARRLTRQREGDATSEQASMRWTTSMVASRLREESGRQFPMRGSTCRSWERVSCLPNEWGGGYRVITHVCPPRLHEVEKRLESYRPIGDLIASPTPVSSSEQDHTNNDNSLQDQLSHTVCQRCVTLHAAQQSAHTDCTQPTTRSAERSLCLHQTSRT